MSKLDEMVPAPRKIMTLFYLIDTSESMQGAKIGTVNSAMKECQSLLSEIAEDDDAEMRVAVMQFSSGCSWITSETEPELLSEWVWKDLIANGITDLGAALKELDSKLSRNAFLHSQTGAYAPVILLFSDGGPTDNWEKGLELLRKNNWYQHAIKIAIDIDSGSDRNVLAEFTGTSEAILEANDRETLKNIIHKVSVRASEFQSHCKMVTPDEETTPTEDSINIVNAVKDEIEESNDNLET